MGLIARGLELAGIATTLTSWYAGATRLTGPPRATFTRLGRGSALGRPGDTAQQRRVLERTLALLAEEAPHPPVLLNESLDGDADPAPDGDPDPAPGGDPGPAPGGDPGSSPGG